MSNIGTRIFKKCLAICNVHVGMVPHGNVIGETSGWDALSNESCIDNGGCLLGWAVG